MLRDGAAGESIAGGGHLHRPNMIFRQDATGQGIVRATDDLASLTAADVAHWFESGPGGVRLARNAPLGGLHGGVRPAPGQAVIAQRVGAS